MGYVLPLPELLRLGTAIIQKAIAPLTSGARRNVLIIDDSLFSCNRSKKVELLARVYDHVSGTYMKGFRMLTLGWSDGNTFLPLSHCLLSSSSKRQQLQGASMWKAMLIIKLLNLS